MTQSDRRLHPLSFLFALGGNARAMLLPGVLALLAARSGNWQVWLLFLFIPYVLVAGLRYLTFRYRFDEDELVIRTGFVFRNERHIPYARIHNIASAQNPLHRLLGVVEARVETAGGQELEARIQVISLGAMEEIRRHVFEQKCRIAEATQPARAVSEAVGASRLSEEDARMGPLPAPRALLRLPLSELTLHGIVDNRGMVVLAAVMGLAWELGWYDDGWIGSKDSWKGLFRTARPFVSVVGGASVLLGGFLLLWLGLRVMSIGWAIVKLYDFRLVLEGRDLRSSYGLITRLTASIPLHRVQVLTVTERPLARLLRRAEVRVETAGGGASEAASATHQRIAPILRRGAVPGLVQVVQPELELGTVSWRSIHPRAWRRLFKAYLLLSAGIAALPSSWIGWWSLVLFGVLVGVSFVNATMHVKRMGWALTDDHVLFRSGWMRLQVSIARHSKIQALVVTESPFDRRHGMAGLQVDTAGAGSSSHRIHIPYLGSGEARRLFEFLAERAALTAFRW